MQKKRYSFFQIVKILVAAVPLTSILFLFENCSSFKGSDSAEFASESVVAPVVSVQGLPSSLTNNPNISIQISTVINTYASVSKVTCTLDTRAPVSCLNSYSAANIPDGSHTLTIQAQDSFGNLSTAYVYIWQIDTMAPVVSFSQAPPAVTGASTTVAFNANKQSTFVCALDDATLVACSSPVSLANLTQAPHTFQVRATDSAGNVSSIATASFRTDVSAPVISILTTPKTPTNLTAASFTFKGVDAENVAITFFSCQLDAQTTADCNTGLVTYENLTVGAHTFTLTGKDLAGNTSSPIKFTWLVDTTPPTVTLTQQPTNPSTSNTATFAFMAQDALAAVTSVQCQLDTQAFQTCTSPQKLSNVAVGAHTFTIRVTDAANNQVNRAVTWAVTAVPAPVISSFIATPSTITSGQTSTLKWTVNSTAGYAVTVTLNGTTEAGTSFTTPALTAAKTYTLIASNVVNGTTQSTSATVTVMVESESTPAPPVTVKDIGYTDQVFYDNFQNFNTIDMTDSKKSGFNWYVSSPGHTQDLSRITIENYNGTNMLRFDSDGAFLNGAQLSADGKTVVGPSFAVKNGGGAYFEANIAYGDTAVTTSNGWPAFWLNPPTKIVGLDKTLGWGGVGSFIHYLELDIMEYFNNTKGFNPHGNSIDWYGDYGSTECGAGKFCQVADGNFYGPGVKGHFTSASETSLVFHKYGALWVPSKQTGPDTYTQGYIQFYLDGVPAPFISGSNKVTFTGVPPSAPQDIASIKPKPDWLFSIIDNEQLALIINTGAGAFMYVNYVSVWQAP